MNTADFRIDIAPTIDALCEQLELGDKKNVQSIILEPSKVTAYVYVTDGDGFKVVDGAPLIQRLSFKVQT